MLNKVEIYRELTPILEEIVALEPENDQHPACKKLLNWLVEPHHTGEEYSYIVGELTDKVYCDNAYNSSNYTIYSIAAEALALRCPVLEGQWEHAAWTLVIAVDGRYQGEAVPDHFAFNNWIIHVIGDPDICPNAYLRFELLNLFLIMVEIENCNHIQVLISVLSACSVFNTDFMSVNILEFHQTHAVESVLSGRSSFDIAYISDNLSKYSHVVISDIESLLVLLNTVLTLEFDKTLAETVLKANVSRCSTMFHDVGYLHAMSPSTSTEPREFHGLFALLTGISKAIQSYWKETHLILSVYDKTAMLVKVRDISLSLYTILLRFNVSCQTPQLVGLASSCILDLVEMLIKINEEFYMVDSFDEYNKQETFNNINQLIECFCLERHNLVLTRKKMMGCNTTWNLEDCSVAVYISLC